MNYSTDEISLMKEASKVADLPNKISNTDPMEAIAEMDIPDPNKKMVSARDINHRTFEKGLFWQHIPAFKDVTEEEFLDTKWQNKNTIHKIAKLQEFLTDLTSEEFIKDA
ncbi:MAG: hypothetical protein RIA63_01210, partial [Cyclobacteriaceae bacterium]